MLACWVPQEAKDKPGGLRKRVNLCAAWACLLAFRLKMVLLRTTCKSLHHALVHSSPWALIVIDLVMNGRRLSVGIISNEMSQ